MDRERRKRKKNNKGEAALLAAPPEEKEEDDDNEEEKMERFFALVRSTRNVKERMLMSGIGNVNNTLRALQPGDDVGGKKILGSENKMPSEVCNPTFQREDFMDGHPSPPPDHPHHPHHRHLESSSTYPLNLNIIPTATHYEEGGAAAVAADGDAEGPSRIKSEEDHHDLDLNLSL